MTGDKYNALKFRNPFWIVDDWTSMYEPPTVSEETKVDGKPAWILNFIGKDESPDRTLYIDVESGLIVQEETSLVIHGVMQLPINFKYSDYHDVGGVMLPLKVVSDNSAAGEVVMIFNKVEKLEERPKFEIADPADKQ